MSILQTTCCHSRVFSIRCTLVLLFLVSCSTPSVCLAEGDSLQLEASLVLKKSIEFYSTQARHGGYVYHFNLDTNQRWGEGLASDTQVWVQPPATPTVGMAYLKAYEVTGEPSYLRYATAAGRALVYGQLKSGGWTNSIDFDPKSNRAALYRNGKGRERNYSSLDDGQTQSAIRLMVALDNALKFQDPQIHESATVALESLLAAQFPNGGFPQVWSGPVSSEGDVLSSKSAGYPDYDWRTQGRIKEYWNMYTINDYVTGYVAETLRDAYRVYDDKNT